MRAVWARCVMGLLLAGCASTKPFQAEPEPAMPPAVDAKATAEAPAMTAESAQSVKYVDPVNGFTIERPDPSWVFRAGEELSTETIVVPLVITNADKGAQVVVQVAPSVATPNQFAERLTTGLKTRAGFATSEIQPIPLAEGAVGFDFEVGDQVVGRVAILEGAAGRVYVLLATWPRGSTEGVSSDVDRILASMKATRE
jgi:hypothetical protein